MNMKTPKYIRNIGKHWSIWNLTAISRKSKPGFPNTSSFTTTNAGASRLITKRRRMRTRTKGRIPAKSQSIQAGQPRRV